MGKGKGKQNSSIRRIAGIALIAVLVILALPLLLEFDDNAQQAGSSLQTTIDDAAQKPNPQQSDYQIATVIKVVDGDTLRVDIEGKTQKVRLIGINTPESVHADESKNTPEGAEASAYTSSLVKKGQTVYLEKDVSEADQYDRLLRYVWLEKPDNHPEEHMLNAILVRDGYAEARDYPPDTAYSELLHSLE